MRGGNGSFGFDDGIQKFITFVNDFGGVLEKGVVAARVEH